MSYETLLFDVADGVGTITFNRPDAANAMSPLCAEEFNDVSLFIEGNTDIRAVLITGNGKMFCAGGDLAGFSAAGDGARALILKMTGDLHLGISRLSRNAAQDHARGLIEPLVQGAPHHAGAAVIAGGRGPHRSSRREGKDAAQHQKATGRG